MWRTGLCGFGSRNWIFLIAAFHLFTYSQGGTEDILRFTTEPSDLVILPGGSAVLPCAPSHPARVRVRWRYRSDLAPERDHVLTYDAHRKQLPNGSLSLDEMSARMAGHYQCVVTAEQFGTIVSRVALVMLAELPKLQPGPRSILASTGSPVLLPCPIRVFGRTAFRVHGAGPPDRRVYGAARVSVPPTVLLNVTWLRNNSPLRLEPSRMTLSSSGALELDPTREHDAGLYTCSVGLAAYTSGGVVTSEPTELRVSSEVASAESPPRFIATPQPITVIEGGSVTFDCAAIGNPKPEMIWLNNGAAIDLSDLDSRFYLVGSGSLRVQSARALDAGAYTCRAHSRLDSTDYTTQLDVVSPPRVSPPTSASVKAAPRGDVTLRCDAKGRPSPRVAWLKDGETVTPNHHDIAIVDHTSLRISGVLAVDAGMFQCMATSIGGSAQQSMRLIVTQNKDEPTNATDTQTSNINAKSFFNSLKPTNYQKPEDTSHDIFSTLISDNNDLDPSYYDSDDSYNDEIAFAYTPSTMDQHYDQTEKDDLLHAAKGLDLDDLRSRNTSLISAPKGLKAVIVKHRFVTLSWEEPQSKGENVTGYAVVYKVKGSERERIIQGSAQKHEINIGSLQPNTTYTFTVIALTEHGASSSTATVEAHTLSSDPSAGAPRGVTGIPRGPHTIEVSWEAPANRPDSYTVHYTEVDSSREQYLLIADGSTTAAITGLRAGTLYGLRVSSGEALSAETRVRTPTDVPSGKPTGLFAGPGPVATSLLVRWEAPPVHTHRGQLTGYKVRYRILGGKKKAESLTTPADARRAELRGLERNTTYQIRVCAINANGSGPYSEWVTATTQPRDLQESSVPPQPPPLTTRAGRDWISVWWAGGAGGAGGGGTGWALGWGLGVPDETARNLPAHAHSSVIRDLLPNSEYVISLRASNSLGLGPPVYATVRTQAGDEFDDLQPDDEDDEEPEEEAPLIPPLGLKVIMLSGTTAVVYWTDPTLPKGQQTATDDRRYVVRYATAGPGAAGRIRTYNASDLNCMLDDLKPFTQYEFAVKLIKGDRESPWSMLVSNTTLEAPPASAPRELRGAPGPGTARPSVELVWAPPAKPQGIITGYVIMYTPALNAEWTASAVSGDRRATRVDRLRPSTTYHFKLQARNSAGLGPFSPTIAVTTHEDSNAGGGLAGATSAWLWASAGGACAVLALAAALALSLCCRRNVPHVDNDRSTYQKSSASTGIKPPDLWIHHDQMELKHLDKSLNSSAMSAHSADGGNALVSSTLTLRTPAPAQAEYEPARHMHPHVPASLDRRHYVPTYVDSRWSASCGGSDSDETAILRAESSNSSRRKYDYSPMSGVGVGCAATCDRRHRMPHNMHPDQSTPLLGGVGPMISPQSSMASLAPLHPPPAPCGSGTCPLGSACSAPVPPGGVGVPGTTDIYACAARERGQYVAYEPLGPYTHRDSISETSQSGGGGGSLQRGGVPGMHSFTHTLDGTGSVRETSPYKKSANSSPGHLPNRLQLGGAVPHCSSELEPLTPSRSTERLQREMQNLEGLMKDLSAITQQQFHC